MTNAIVCCVSIVALVAATAPARSVEPAANDTQVLSTAKDSDADCEARIRKLDTSQAEGNELLAEKNAVLDFCASQYKNDKMIDGLVQECVKYEEQPIVKQQFLAGCQLAAFSYANALYALKAWYGK